MPDVRKSTSSLATSSSDRSTSSAAALRLFQQEQQEPEDEEEEPAFLPSSPQTSRPSSSHAPAPPLPPTTTIAMKDNDSPNLGSDSFSDLSDASISKSALEEALDEHLRRGGSVAGSQMQGGVRSLWKGKFSG